jgi:tol-pal system protein YbgF
VGGDVGGDGASDEAGVVVLGQDDDVLASMQSARELYAWAQARLKEARYLEAVAGFEEIALRFPKDDLADNSLYWIGVCHQGRGEHRLAIAEWQKLPARFPKSPKIPDALFGMAQSHEALLEPAVAEVLYDEVVGSYPKAEKYKEAKKAIARLRPPMPGPR